MLLRGFCSLLCLFSFSGLAVAEEDKQLFWGDTHLHSSYSFDAYLFQNRTADPDTAYRYAKGLPVVHPFHRARVQIDTPLDFLVVADHAELLGVVRGLGNAHPELQKLAIGREFTQMMKEGRESEVFGRVVAGANDGSQDNAVMQLFRPDIQRSMWKEVTDAADRHNEPGKFTSFIGWEWSAMNDGANLHRIVMTSASAEQAQQFLPYSSIQSWKAEDLWAWMDETSSKHNIDILAIPHNPNISKGEMFNDVDSDGRPLNSEYARQRMRWEPVAEVTQIKGDSETHPLLSPNDEFADFETYRYLIDTRPDVDKTAPVNAGSYMRSALKRGLEQDAKIGANPFKFGVIGSTDSHTGLASAEETNFHGKMPIDGTPAGKSKMRVGKQGASGWDMAASGLAAVWAERNDRQSIMDAFKRKEVYATSGSRIQVQMFAGWQFKKRHAESKRFAQIGRSKGVPMGGDLSAAPKRKAPGLIVRASRDPNSAPLQRLQIVKGYLDGEGIAREKIYTPALNEDGAEEFALYWQDPDFDASQRAFYYVRVLELPVTRHTTYDAQALMQDPVAGHPTQIQERAYTSPVWYTP
jgi:hypothetical protein